MLEEMHNFLKEIEQTMLNVGLNMIKRHAELFSKTNVNHNY